MSKLTKTEQRVYDLSFYNSYGEIAETLRMSRAAVKRRYKKAIAKIGEAEHLQNEQEADLRSLGIVIDGHPVEPY